MDWSSPQRDCGTVLAWAPGAGLSEQPLAITRTGDSSAAARTRGSRTREVDRGGEFSRIMILLLRLHFVPALRRSPLELRGGSTSLRAALPGPSRYVYMVY